MANKKDINKISKSEKQLLEGLELVNQHPIFRRLCISNKIVNKNELGKNIPAKVSSSGVIYLNKNCDKTPNEWAYLIAHCMLHLSFGHFDAERMPGY